MRCVFLNSRDCHVSEVGRHVCSRSPVPKSSTVHERWEKKQTKFPCRLLLASILAALAVILAPCIADILGFGNFSGFTVNQDDTASAPTASGGTIQLTDENTSVSEYRSIFNDTPQNISDFPTCFTYQGSGPGPFLTPGPGACFVLQNSTSDAIAVAAGNFGYASFPGLSIRITLQLLATGKSGYFTDGNAGGLISSPSTSPVNLLAGWPWAVARPGLPQIRTWTH